MGLIKRGTVLMPRLSADGQHLSSVSSDMSPRGFSAVPIRWGERHVDEWHSPNEGKGCWLLRGRFVNEMRSYPWLSLAFRGTQMPLSMPFLALSRVDLWLRIWGEFSWLLSGLGTLCEWGGKCFLITSARHCVNQRKFLRKLRKFLLIKRVNFAVDERLGWVE